MFGIGASDITDVIINTIGGIIGLGIYMIISKIFMKDYKVKNFIAICSTIIMIPISVILLLIFMHK